MGNIFRFSLIAVLVIMLTSCEEIYDSYRVKIVNDSNQNVSVYLTEAYGIMYINKTEVVKPSGRSIIVPKGESFEYDLSIYKYDKKNAYVAFLFSDKEIDIDTDILNQEPNDSEARKFLILKHSLQELFQINNTVTFSGFENE